MANSKHANKRAKQRSSGFDGKGDPLSSLSNKQSERYAKKKAISGHKKGGQYGGSPVDAKTTGGGPTPLTDLDVRDPGDATESDHSVTSGESASPLVGYLNQSRVNEEKIGSGAASSSDLSLRGSGDATESDHSATSIEDSDSVDDGDHLESTDTPPRHESTRDAVDTVVDTSAASHELAERRTNREDSLVGAVNPVGEQESGDEEDAERTAALPDRRDDLLDMPAGTVMGSRAGIANGTETLREDDFNRIPTIRELLPHFIDMWHEMAAGLNVAVTSLQEILRSTSARFIRFLRSLPATACVLFTEMWNEMVAGMSVVGTKIQETVRSMPARFMRLLRSLPTATCFTFAQLCQLRREAFAEAVRELARQGKKVESATHKHLPGPILVLPYLPGQKDVIEMLIESPLVSQSTSREIVEAEEGKEEGEAGVIEEPSQVPPVARGKKRKAGEMETPTAQVDNKTHKPNFNREAPSFDKYLYLRPCAVLDLIQTADLEWSRRGRVFYTFCYVWESATSENFRDLCRKDSHKFEFADCTAYLSCRRVSDLYVLTLYPEDHKDWKETVLDKHFDFLRAKKLLKINDNMFPHDQACQLDNLTSPENVGKTNLVSSDEPKPQNSLLRPGVFGDRRDPATLSYRK